MLTIIFNLLAAATFAFILFGAYVAAEAYYYQGRIGSALQKELGFREGSTYNHQSRSRLESAVAIVEVDEGGVMQRAGFRPGDAILRESHSSFFKRLHRNRGREVEFTTVPGGNGPPFHKRPLRTIRFVVPAL